MIGHCQGKLCKPVAIYIIMKKKNYVECGNNQLLIKIKYLCFNEVCKIVEYYRSYNDLI